MPRAIQTSFFKKEKSDYGGELRKKRKGREGPRILATRSTMHMVLRSTKAKGEWAFTRPAHKKSIQEILQKFCPRYGVKILSFANVGNHLHFQLKLSNRFTYKPFIQAITGAIAMAVTGTSRWNPLKKEGHKDRFWDYRPFTRIVESFRAFLNMKDYMRINQLEGYGYCRAEARWILSGEKLGLNTG